MAWGLAILPLLGFWLTGLFDLDEGFYATVTAEMVRAGDWIVPTFNGRPWLEKPILLYWLAHLPVQFLGEAVGPRLAGVLCFIGLWIVLFRFARPYVGSVAAILAVLVLATSPLAFGAARMMLTDGPLLLCLSLALLAFYRSLTDGPRWRWLSGLALGLAILAKGPVGLALFVPVAALTYWREPSLRSGFRGGWLGWGAALAAAVSLWYLPAYLRLGDLFVHKFLIEQNVGRFTGGDAAHSVTGFAGIVFYPVVLLVGMIPWAFLVFSAWPRPFVRVGEGDPFLRFCALWSLVVIAFFTISAAKLPHYVLPAAVPLAVVVGSWLSRRRPSADLQGAHLVGPGLAAAVWLVLANVAFGQWYASSGHAEIHALTRWVRSQQALPVMVFQMPRRQADRGTGRADIQETSHPSIPFYLGRTVIDGETLEDLVRSPKPAWVLTRENRFSPELQQAMLDRGIVVTQPAGAPEAHHYRVYRLNDLRATK